MSLTCNGQIYQSEEGSDFGNQIPPGLDDADSWFTIGAENSSDGVDVSSIGLEGALNSFNQGQGFVLDPLFGAAWFVTLPCNNTFFEPCEDEHLAYGGIDHRVLLAQITANAPISGVWNIQVYIGGNTDRSRKLVVEGTGDLMALYSTNTGAGGAQLDLSLIHI